MDLGGLHKSITYKDCYRSDVCSIYVLSLYAN